MCRNSCIVIISFLFILIYPIPSKAAGFDFSEREQNLPPRPGTFDPLSTPDSTSEIPPIDIEKIPLATQLPLNIVKKLNRAETLFLINASQGSPVEIDYDFPEGTTPNSYESWTSQQQIRAEVLEAILTSERASSEIQGRKLSISGAIISGNLNLSDATVMIPIEFSSCGFPEGIKLADASIRRILFQNCLIQSLSMEGLVSEGSVVVANSIVQASLRMICARIGGNLELDRSILSGEGIPSSDLSVKNFLTADSITVRGGVYLRNGFEAKGPVSMICAHIGGDLDCHNGSFQNSLTNGNALNCDRCQIGGNVFLDSDFKAVGEVRFVRAKIGADLDCKTGSILHPEKKALNIFGAMVGGTLFIREMKHLAGKIDLSDAEVGLLGDDDSFWVPDNQIYLHGLVFRNFQENSPLSAEQRIRWLQQQPTESYSFEPYERLAAVFKKSGLESEATRVLIEKKEALRKHGNLGPLGKAWNWFLGVTISHGYETWRVVFAGIIFIIVGRLIFARAESAEQLVKKPDILWKKFHPWMYSFDAFIPIVNLRVAEYYLPAGKDASSPVGYRIYFWIHTLAGWIISTLAVISLTGLAR